MKKKYIPKKKFLINQYLTFHALGLKLKDNYPNIAEIKTVFQESEKDLQAQEQTVHNYIKMFNLYFTNRSQVDTTILFFLVLHVIVSFGIACFINPLIAPFYLGGALILSGGVTLIMYPFLVDILKILGEGENYQSLIDYYNKLKAMKVDKYDKGEPEKEVKIAQVEADIKTEEQYLTPDLVTSRNAAVWQVNAFRENMVYWRQIFTPKDYESMRAEIKVITDLLSSLRHAEGKNKLLVAQAIDEHLNVLNELYAVSNRDKTLSRTRKI